MTSAKIIWSLKTSQYSIKTITKIETGLLALTVRILKWHQRNQSTVSFCSQTQAQTKEGLQFSSQLLADTWGRWSGSSLWWTMTRQMDGWIRGTANGPSGCCLCRSENTFSKPCTRFSRFPQLFISSQKTGSDQLRIVGKPGFLWGFCKVIFMSENSLFVEINDVSLLLFEDMVVYFSASIWSNMFMKNFLQGAH